jgi:DNA-binding CsgD family transcriptional regulator
MVDGVSIAKLDQKLDILTSSFLQLREEIEILKGRGSEEFSGHQSTNSAIDIKPHLTFLAKAIVLSSDTNHGTVINGDTVSRMESTVEERCPLTPRETQILNQIAKGNTNKQIAYILHTSEQTVKNQVSSVLLKLNANDRAHAVAIGMQEGWVS